MCHVLIIEDDAIAALDIQAVLKSQGATSFSFAATEREAVQCARDQRPALITSDVMLARGSGPSALRTILAECGPTPVIFITATPDQCDGHLASPVLEKPFNSERLGSEFRAVAPIF